MAAKVAIAGANGRMGKMLIEALLASDDLSLSGALTQAGSADIGVDASAFLGRDSGVLVTDKRDEALDGAKLLIDFTTPEGTRENLAACVARGMPIVIGTTGFDAAGRDAIAAAGRTIGVVFAPNMSVGVNVALALISLASRALPDTYDAEIVEIHHRDKRDAPSGTALQMGEIVAAGRGTTLSEVNESPRHGAGVRAGRSIGIASLRGGDVIGDHTVVFAGPGERIEITHRAASRMTYAEGSLIAARFLLEKGTPGVFSMRDVLGLHPR
jgi:4-hydroxy-tetrahydrodipicolinate reductase